MGACNFTAVGTGKTAKEDGSRIPAVPVLPLCVSSRIGKAEKHSFVMISVPPGIQAADYVEQLFDRDDAIETTRELTISGDLRAVSH